MIRLNGTLIVKKVNGTRGAFSVGDLVTEVGTFKVKDAILDQYEDGRYTGEFGIARLFLSSYVWRGRSMTDIRAVLVDISLDHYDEEAPAPAGVAPQDELDPIEEEGRSRTAEAASAIQSSSEATVVVVTPSGDVDVDPVLEGLVKLFGTDSGPRVWRGEHVKLDPTVDRGLFREQRDRLKELGYRFDAKTQSWVKDNPPTPQA